jgi:hypothetical protein
MEHLEWIKEGLKKPGKSQAGLAEALGRQPSMVTELFKGNRALKAFEIPIIAAYLGVIPPAATGTVKIVGRIGPRTNGHVQFAPPGQNMGRTPMPLGGTSETVAIEVEGDLYGTAKDGSLIYYDATEAEPTDQMMGELCVVALSDGRAVIKYIHPGREPGHYDLESSATPTERNVQLRWAALVTAIIPGPQAKKLKDQANFSSDGAPQK